MELRRQNDQDVKFDSRLKGEKRLKRTREGHLRADLAERSISWANRLSAYRVNTFVGRSEELELLRQLAHAPHLPFPVLAVVGPAGSGKTTLLKRFAVECDRLGVAHKYLDARMTEPAARSFMRSLYAVLGLHEQDDLTHALAQRGRFVLMIDNFELLESLHEWLSEAFLPKLPEHTLVVIACRKTLPELWRTDSAWKELIRPISLNNFSPEEVRAYLSLRTVPEAEHEQLLRFSRGHPLALSLLADLYDQRPDFIFHPEKAPDVMQSLVRRLVGDVKNPLHRTALEAASIVRVTTEAVLAEMLGKKDARAEFEWLCSLSFMDFSHLGIYPHDLIRNALSHDLRWRHPDRFEELRRRACDFYTPRLSHANEATQQEILADYLFLYRDHAALKPFFEEHDGEPILPACEPATQGDHARLLSIIEHHEGENSARILAYWLERQPEGAWLVRGSDGQAQAFILTVCLDQSSEADTHRDPTIRAIWEYLQKKSLLKPGDVAAVTRFIVDNETYQTVSPRTASFIVTLLRHWLTMPNLKFAFNILADPEVWEPHALSSDFFKPEEELQFKHGERTMGVFMQDWREEPPSAWLARIASLPQQTGLTFPEQMPSTNIEHQLLEQRHEFTTAVRDALKNLHVPDVLALNPLVNSRLVKKAVEEKADSDSKVQALQSSIIDVIEFLGTVPARKKLYRALRFTYMEPKGTQEQVAEWLELPFSTYRGHLRAGINVLADILWRKDKEAEEE